MIGTILTIPNITFAIGIITLIVGAVIGVKKPQSDLEKLQAVTQKEADGKALLLSQQLQYDKEANERRFKDVNDSIVATTAMAQNHIHTVDTKVDNLISVVNSMSNRITELSTIISERIPRHERI